MIKDVPSLINPPIQDYLDNVYSELPVGTNIHIVATIFEYNKNNGLFFLNPVSITKR